MPNTPVLTIDWNLPFTQYDESFDINIFTSFGKVSSKEATVSLIFFTDLMASLFFCLSIQKEMDLNPFILERDKSFSWPSSIVAISPRINGILLNLLFNGTFASS